MMILYFIIGCLLGWGLSLLLPTTYRATSQIFVSLNPYRAYSDSNFVALAKPRYSNIDDYKNWQMAELEALISLDEILADTLKQLQRVHPFWETIDTNQLEEMLTSEWRSAGTWSLTAENPDPLLAEQAARAWSQVAVDSVSDANQAALRTFLIDEELKRTIENRNGIHTRLRTITAIAVELQEWSMNSAQSTSNQPLELNERWYVETLAAGAADFSPGWLALLEKLPSENAPASAYSAWIAQILEYLERERMILESESAALEEQSSLLEDQYRSTFEQSKAISPNLVVEELNHLPTRRLHPSPVLALIGGIIGLLGWLFVRLVQISRSEKR